MHYDIDHPDFTVRRLSVEIDDKLFAAPRLLLDGQPAKAVKGKYTVASDAGTDTMVRFKASFPDPIPRLAIGKEMVTLAPALKWYAQAWILLPFGLVAVGGAIGGLCGSIAAITNGRIFRGEQGALARYTLSGLVTLAAVLAWLAFAIVMHALLGAPHR